MKHLSIMEDLWNIRIIIEFYLKYTTKKYMHKWLKHPNFMCYKLVLSKYLFMKLKQTLVFQYAIK